MSKKRPSDANLSFKVKNNIVYFYWTDSRHKKIVTLECDNGTTFTLDSWHYNYQTMDLIKFQNLGLMKAAPWIYNLHCDIKDTIKYHKQFKERLDRFYKEFG